MEDFERKEILSDIGYLIRVQDIPKLQMIALGAHPADLADVVLHFDPDERRVFFNTIDAEIAAEVILDLDEEVRKEIVEDLENKRLSELVEEMESDDAADFVSDLPGDVADQVLEEIEPEDSAEVKALLRHEEDTAGGIMALELIAVEGHWTIEQAIQEIRRKAEDADEFYNVYVVDKQGKLIGTLPLQKLILAGPHMRVDEVMDRDVFSVSVDMDQEMVANYARKYDLVAMPVIDQQGRLVGRITIDDVVDVIEEEVVEDISHMAGILSESSLKEQSILRISRVRLPWLVIGLFGGMVAAWLLKAFEHEMQANIIMLLFFVPVIMAMGGNAAIQSSTIIVRALATGDSTARGKGKRMLREVAVALLNGSLCAILIFIIIMIGWREPSIGILVGSSLLCVMFVASIVGASVPLMLRNFNVDPAIATGPFITISNDILGLFIYMAIASYFF